MMPRFVIGFHDSTEIAVERSGAGELLVHAKLADRHIDELGLRGFARPVLPGSIEVTLAGMPVEMVRWLSRAHGGIDKAWSEKAAFALLQEFAAAEAPWQPSPEIPDDPPELAAVLRRPREAASQAAPFRGADAAVPGAPPVHDGAGLRPVEIDPVSIAYQEARPLPRSAGRPGRAAHGSGAPQDLDPGPGHPPEDLRPPGDRVHPGAGP